jgi:hypothetical protein
MTDAISPALLNSPTFLLTALIAGRKTRDKALERLASRQLARLGIKVCFASDLPQPAGTIDRSLRAAAGGH